MHINLNQIGKRFNREWVFRKIDLDIPSASRLAVLGANGSGKSTLLQLLSGALSATEGKITYQLKGNEIPVEEAFQYFSIAAPYLELVEEMTLLESVEFHFSFKKKYRISSTEEFISILGLEKAIHKEIRYFSSGMKQRLKLALAVLSDVHLILLDEPCSNLDQQGIAWYQQLLEKYIDSRTLVVCSNQDYEYKICDKSLSIMEYKSV